MGSQNSMQLIQNPLPKDYVCSYESPNIFISIVDHTKLEKHSISIASKTQLTHQQQMFFFRRCNSDHIVTAKYFENISVNQICANSYEVTYYTEYPENRFNDILSMEYAEGYSYLIDCLKGFQILSQKVGWFKVTHKMIMFDKDGKIKVWISQNFAQTKVKRSEKLTSEKQFLQIIVNLFDQKQQQNSEKGLRSPKNSQNISYWNLILKNLIKNNRKLTIKQSLNLLITLAPNYIETARSFLGQSTENDSEIVKLKQRTQSKDSSQTKTKFSTKNHSNKSSGTQVNSQANSPMHKFNKDKQRSLKKYKKVSQESQTIQENLNTNNRNTVATIQMHSPMFTRFTINPTSHNQNQKIIINHHHRLTNRQHCQNLSNFSIKSNLFDPSKQQTIISFNKDKHRAFKSHGKRDTAMKNQNNNNSRKSMDEILNIKKSSEQNYQAMPFNNLCYQKIKPIEVNYLVKHPIQTENRNTLNINPDCTRFYEARKIPMSNFSEATKMAPTRKISKTNFEPLGRKFIRKKYEDLPRRELITKPCSPNPCNQFQESDNNRQLQCPKQLSFANQFQSNQTVRYYVRLQNQNRYTNGQSSNIKLQEKQIGRTPLNQNDLNVQRKPLDQLHTIKSIVYSQANVSEALSLELAQNGFSRHIFKGNIEGQI